MTTKGRAQKGSRIPLTGTRNRRITIKFDGGKVEGHINLQCIVRSIRAYFGNETHTNGIYISTKSAEHKKINLADKQN